MSDLGAKSTLRSMVGRRVRYRGEIHIVIEVIERPPALVLETTGETQDAEIQGDSLGYAHRRTPHQEVVTLGDDAGELDLPSAGVNVLDDTTPGAEI
jgi:hypothetical protein